MTMKQVRNERGIEIKTTPIYARSTSRFDLPSWTYWSGIGIHRTII